jgi:hypothetical protein
MSVGFVFYSKFVLRICLYIVSNKSPVMVNSHLTHLRAEDLVGRLGLILIHKKAPYGVGR